MNCSAINVRTICRRALLIVGIVALTPIWLPARYLPEPWFASCSEMLSLLPGKLGIFARRSFYCMTLEASSADVHVGFGTTFAHREARIGRGVYIGNRCTMGMCEIGEHATIGSNVDILSGRRQHFYDTVDRPIQQQGGHFVTIRLGRNCWIGNSAVVMNDVGEDCVIGAGAVVVNSIPNCAIAVGNPALVKRTRAVA